VNEIDELPVSFPQVIALRKLDAIPWFQRKVDSGTDTDNPISSGVAIKLVSA
jgi:hypothetical protein